MFEAIPELSVSEQFSSDELASRNRDVIWESTRTQANQISQFCRQALRISRPHPLVDQFQARVFPQTIRRDNDCALARIAYELMRRCDGAAEERFPRLSACEFLLAVRSEQPGCRVADIGSKQPIGLHNNNHNAGRLATVR